MTAREQEVFRLIEQNPSVTHEEIAKKLGISRSTVAVHIASIMQQGLITGKGYILSEEYAACIGISIMDVFGFEGAGVLQGDKNPGGRVRISRGGAARNIAENLARLGHPVKFLSAVGDDAFGRQLLAECAAAGMDVSAVKVVPGEATATYVCVLNREGEIAAAVTDTEIGRHETVGYFKANDRLLRGAGAIVITAEPMPGVMAYLAGAFPDTPIYADAASASDAATFRANLGCYRFLKMSRMEAAAVAGMPIRTDDELQTAAKWMIAQGLEQAVITMGQEGAFYLDADGLCLRQRAIAPSRLANASGAGDAFSAAFIYGALHGKAPQDCLELAAAAAAVTLQCEQSINPDLCLPLVEETALAARGRS